MTIAIASDHAGFELKTYLCEFLKNQNILLDFGTHSSESMDYPDVAHLLADAIEKNEAEIGIILCGSGNGVNMTVNKHKGIRAALCWNLEISKLARQHNNANVLCIPARFVSKELAVEMVKAFLTEKFEGGRHLNRVNKISC